MVCCGMLYGGVSSNGVFLAAERSRRWDGDVSDRPRKPELPATLLLARNTAVQRGTEENMPSGEVQVQQCICVTLLVSVQHIFSTASRTTAV